jgi:hypothetical protein
MSSNTSHRPRYRVAALIALFVLPVAALAQQEYFRQDFTGPGPYTSRTPSNTQFDTIYSTVPSGTQIRLTPGQGYVEFVRSGATGSGTGRIVRSTDLSPLPSTMYFEVRMNVVSTTTTTSNIANFSVGRNFSPSLGSLPLNDDVFGKFSVNIINDNSYFFRRTDFTPLNSGTYRGEVLITWVLNNLPTPLPYLAPNGDRLVLAPRTFDVWINNDLFLKDSPRVSNSEVPLSDFAFRLQNGGLTMRLIDFRIREVEGVLPVNLLWFRAQTLGNRVNLAWETAWERNSREFIVQRSTDLREFADLATLPATGDSQSRNSYSFVDETPEPGVAYYRLRMVDADGTYEYSRVIDVGLQPDQPLLLVTPNPAEAATIRLHTNGIVASSLRLTTLLGQDIPFRAESIGGGMLELFPQQPLPTGVYLLSHEHEGQRQQTKVLVR